MSLVMTRPLSNGRGVLRQALGISVLVHAALVGGLFGVLRMPAREAAASPQAPEPPPAITSDIWAGDSPLPGAGHVVDVEVEGAGHAAPAPPADRPTVEAEPPPTAAPTAAADPVKAADPVPRKKKSARPTPTTEPGERDAPAVDGKAGEAAGHGPGGAFGAEGPGAIRDLGRAFTRAIPPGSDSDPAWKKLPLGDAGSLEITIDVDPEGKITGWRPNEKDPPAHLVGMVKRTIGGLASGTFAVRPGAVSAGSEVVVVRARVSDVAVPEAHAAEPYDLTWKYESGRGTASFTQVGGRHVEVTVTVKAVKTP